MTLGNALFFVVLAMMFFIIGVGKGWSMAFSYLGLAAGLSIATVFLTIAWHIARKR
jgi:hypothetical protein